MKDDIEITVNGEGVSTKRITDIVITRAFSHRQQAARAGHVIYKFGWKVRTGVMEDGVEVVEKWSHAAQLTLAYEAQVGQDGVKDYLKKKFILKESGSE